MKKFNKFQIKSSNCPNCNTVLDGAGYEGEYNGFPEKGDFTKIPNEKAHHFLRVG